MLWGLWCDVGKTSEGSKKVWKQISTGQATPAHVSETALELQG